MSNTFAELRTAAEQQIGPIIKALDRENAWKMRDEMLGFRRRFRLFAHSPEEPYLTHMKATLNVFHDYVENMSGQPNRYSKDEIAHIVRLGMVLKMMVDKVAE